MKNFKESSLLQKFIKAVVRQQENPQPIKMYLILFVILIYVATFYPGYLTADSIYMLNQGIGNSVLSNWHPPFIVRLWGSLFSFFQTAGPLWLSQIFIYIVAVYLFSRTIKNPFLSLFSIVVLLLFPPIFTNMGALWKDCWAVSVTLLTLVFSYRFFLSEKWLDMLTSIFFALITSLIRPDYVLIIAPFMVFNIFKTVWGREKKITFFFTYFFGVFLAGAYLHNFVNTSVQTKLNPWITSAIWDVVGTRTYAGVNAEGVSIYNCSYSDNLVFNDKTSFKVNLPERVLKWDRQLEARAFLDEWFSTITKYPFSYLRHRMCVARIFLGFGDKVHYPYPSSIMSTSSLTQSVPRSPLNIKLYWIFDSISNSCLFRYWYYIFFSIILISFCYSKRSHTIFDLLIFMSIILAAARVLVLPASDFRYGLWILIGTLTLFLVVLDRKNNLKKSS